MLCCELDLWGESRAFGMRNLFYIRILSCLWYVIMNVAGVMYLENVDFFVA